MSHVFLKAFCWLPSICSHLMKSRTPHSHDGLVKPHMTWAQHPFDLMSHSVFLAPSALATRAYLLTLNIAEIFLLQNLYVDVPFA